MQLHPGENFTPFRILGDHTDPTTYYVRAVIRNAKTAALIETLDLTDNGSGDFTGTFQVPQDTSGQGFYLKVATSVYTDSEYTTKSSNHADEGETYLVQDRLRRFGGGGGGVDVDYDKIKKIVAKEVKKHEAKYKEGIGKRYDNLATGISNVLNSLTEAQTKILNAMPPEPESTDLEPVLSGLEEIVQTIDTLPVPESVDLSGIERIQKSLKLIKNDVEKRERVIVKTIDDHVSGLVKVVSELKKEMRQMPKKISFNIQPIEKTDEEQTEEEQQGKKGLFSNLINK